ncbi:MAG: ribosome-associated translation inhibitor RaiA [Planctomycetota bacterium]|nr:ribosome-associated translation inhibitor RaiA [Planctomycetota bacterium]
MNVTITGRHLRITDDMKDYARDRAERMSKYFERIKKIEVVLSAEGDHYTAEIIVACVRGMVLVGHVRDYKMAAAVDLVVDKLERQLTRFKERLKNKRPRRRATAEEE